MLAVCVNTTSLEHHDIKRPEDGICALLYHLSVQSRMVSHYSPVSSCRVDIISTQESCIGHC